MSVWQWFLAAGMAALVVWEIAGILGPFELDDAERPAAATRSQLVRAWCAGWLRRPREPLSFGEWMPHNGRMFLPSLLTGGLVYGGAWVLFGSHQTFRLGGALALLVGLPLLLAIVGYVMRPVGALTRSPVGSGFPTARRGYKVAEVDRVFAELPSMSRDDIDGVRFHTAAGGYDREAVDRALEQAAQSRLR